MTPHQLGESLRDQVLRQRQRMGRAQGQRLEAVIRDLCAEDHQDFCAPLCFLVTSAAFVTAVERDPPLTGPALLNAWNLELGQIYASDLCRRLQPVLAGLLNLPPPGAGSGASPQQPRTSWAVATPAPPPRPAGSPTAAQPTPSPDPRPELTPSASATAGRRGGVTSRFAGAKTFLFTALAFLGGVLLPLALALGLGIGIGRKPSPGPSSASLDRGLPVPSPRPAPSLAAAPATSPLIAAPTTASATPEPTQTPGATTAPEEPAAAQQRAINSVQQLYAALAAKDYERARGYVGAEAADQFQPGSLEAYEQVSILDLWITGQRGTTVELEGVLSLVQSDGNRHQETRSFSVDVASEPAIVIASAFGRVLP
jgi:hypothetical protein